MKRIASIFLSLVIIVITLLSPLTTTASMAAPLSPAAFKDVTYHLKSGVVEVNRNQLLPNIKSAEQLRGTESATARTPQEKLSKTAYMLESQLRSIKRDFMVGTVFVDLTNRTAVKVKAISGNLSEAPQFSGYVALEKPELFEVLEDFDIPSQDVVLNNANITAYGEGMEECLITGKNQGDSSDYTVRELDEWEQSRHLSDPFKEFKFVDKKFTATNNDGGKVQVTLNGYLGIDRITVHGKYSCWNGYEFYIKTGEELRLSASAAISMKKEYAIPLCAIDVDAYLGQLKGGLFLVVGMDGNITLKCKVDQWFNLSEAGIKGDTFAYIPTSFEPKFGFADKGFNADVSFSASLNGYIKVGPMFQLTILDKEMIGAGAMFGLGVESNIVQTLSSGKDTDIINAKICGIVNIYASILDHRKDIVNWRPQLFEMQQAASTKGYVFTLKEADAYRKAVWGRIEKDEGVDGINPISVDYDLVVTDSNETIKHTYRDKTDANGEFKARNVDMAATDKVFIAVVDPGVASPDPSLSWIARSDNMKPTFPFNSVTIEEADYFNDYVKGTVNPVIVSDYDNGGTVELVYTGDVTVAVTTNGSTVTKTGRCDQYGNYKVNVDIFPNSRLVTSINYLDYSPHSGGSTVPIADIRGDRISVPVITGTYTQDNRRIDYTTENEFFIVKNLNGSKALTGGTTYNSQFGVLSKLCFIDDPISGRPMVPPVYSDSRTLKVNLTAIPSDLTVYKNARTASTGSKFTLSKKGQSMFLNVFTTELVWAKNVSAKRSDTSLASGKAPGSVVAPSPANANAPQKNVTYRYESPYTFEEVAVNPNKMVYLKRTGELVIPYEGTTIRLTDPDDEPEENDGGRGSTLFDTRLREILQGYWRVINPASDKSNTGIANINSLPIAMRSATSRVVASGFMDLDENGAFRQGNVTRGDGAAYLVRCFGIPSSEKKSRHIDIPYLHPNRTQINAAISTGLMGGLSDTQFGTFEPLTREVLAESIMKGLKQKYGAKLTIKASNVAYKDIATLSANTKKAIDEVTSLKIMTASSAGSFSPKGYVTYNDFAMILDKIASLSIKK